MIRLDGSKSNINEQLLTHSVDDLDLNVRVSNYLRSKRAKTVGDILKIETSELMQARNFGAKSLNILRFELAKYGLFLLHDPFWTTDKFVSLSRQKPTLAMGILERLDALEKKIKK